MPTPIAVQSYALVLVVNRADLKIKATSSNSSAQCGRSPDELLQLTLADLFSVAAIDEIKNHNDSEVSGVVKLEQPAGWAEGKFQAIVHTTPEEWVIEVEPRRTWPNVGDYSARLNDFTRELEAQPDLDALLQKLCDGISYHLAYDRTIIIQFDDLHNGIVTHEARDGKLPGMLNLRFVEEDVPATTRYNQLLDPILSYTEVNDESFEVVGEYSAGSKRILRQLIAARGPNENTSQYLRDSFLSTVSHLSLIVDGALWGSVYFHGIKPIYLDYQMRSFLRIVGRVAQQKIAYHIYSRSLRLEQEANQVRDRLYSFISEADDLSKGLTQGETTLLHLLEDTVGAAICSEDELTLHEMTPTEEEVDLLVKWMKEYVGDDKIWHTDNLSGHYASAKAYSKHASGLLYMPLDPAANQWVIWFRPEEVQNLSYGSVSNEELGARNRIFTVNESTCYNCSSRWTEDHVGTAQALQDFLKTIVMERYASTRRSNQLLKEAYKDLEIFSYTIGHDLRAPLRGISSYADILMEDFEEALGEVGKNHLQVIQDSTERMRIFLDDLLKISLIDRNRFIVNRMAVSGLVERVLADRLTSAGSSTRFLIHDDLPDICGDRNSLITVFTNLLSNAFKYSSGQSEPHVEVGFTGEYRRGNPIFYVYDNGIGIPVDQQERIFELFTRSTNSGTFEGTGIGLALVHRIIRYHEGDIWVESEMGKGTRFLFYTGVVPISTAD